jgi:uncharacterized protein YbjT (DUF2867 family)
MRILVTGGAGALGSLVVAQLQERGHDAVPASRRTGVDLSSGAGLAGVVQDVEAVVHCATSPPHARSVDVGGTGRLVAALAGQPRAPHLVAISIVGCDLNPYPYYVAKTAAEGIIMGSGLPATIVRATQFHTLAALLGRALSIGPFALTLGEMAVQPVDPAWVASQLADAAVGPRPDRPTRATDLAGPELLTMAQVVSALRAQAGRPAPRLIRIPPVGGTMRAFSARTNIPGPEALSGGLAFAEWLSLKPRGRR